MNPNYPSGLIGYGWNTGQNVTPAPRWEQPQIGFCFDSPNPPAPEVHPPIQNRGVVGFNIDQVPVNPPSTYSFPANNPQCRISEDSFRNSIPPPRPSIPPPTIGSNSPKPYGGNDEYRSVTPTAPPEPSPIPITSSPSSEAVHVITISKPDPYKSRKLYFSNEIYRHQKYSFYICKTHDIMMDCHLYNRKFFKVVIMASRHFCLSLIYKLLESLW
ncbi:unnamed protein product [Trichobilharzia regenti]|nr:unnamed protein product [Trichobilharzia regenti]